MTARPTYKDQEGPCQATPSQDTGEGWQGPSSPDPVGHRGYSCHACGKTFTTLGGFGFHRTGAFTKLHPDYGRRCLSAVELEARGFMLVHGRWGRPLSDKAAARLMALKEKRTGSRKG